MKRKHSLKHANVRVAISTHSKFACFLFSIFTSTHTHRNANILSYFEYLSAHGLVAFTHMRNIIYSHRFQNIKVESPSKNAFEKETQNRQLEA